MPKAGEASSVSVTEVAGCMMPLALDMRFEIGTISSGRSGIWKPDIAPIR